jgi:hypothetical protein
MSTNARWIVGLLLVLVIGLGVALIIVAGDDSSNDGTVVLPTITGQTSQTTTQTPTVTTVPAPSTEDSGGVAPPSQ